MTRSEDYLRSAKALYFRGAFVLRCSDDKKQGPEAPKRGSFDIAQFEPGSDNTKRDPEAGIFENHRFYNVATIRSEAKALTGSENPRKRIFK